MNHGKKKMPAKSPNSIEIYAYICFHAYII